MTTRLKLKPGQRGTKKFVEMYGDALVCVRYRYDEGTCTRVKTVEIVVETKAWTPPPSKYAADEIVPVRITIAETSLKKLARASGGRWDPEEKLWFIQYGKIQGTPLAKHIILDAFAESKPEKHIILDAS
jgi:hypothetical protein